MSRHTFLRITLQANIMCVVADSIAYVLTREWYWLPLGLFALYSVFSICGELGNHKD